MPVFQALRYNRAKGEAMEGLKMWEITNLAVTRDAVGHAFRRARDPRRRQRDHGILRWLAGKSGPELAPWLSRDEETRRRWVQAFHPAGRPGLAREAAPGRPA
jgi:hypothetical protein